MANAYCLSCRERTHFQPTASRPLANGGVLLTGRCPRCNAKVAIIARQPNLDKV